MFEYFAVDDAVLLLEEFQEIDEGAMTVKPPELYWTLGVVQNKFVRNLTRLASNNPDLLRGIVK